MMAGVNHHVNLLNLSWSWKKNFPGKDRYIERVADDISQKGGTTRHRPFG